MCYALSQVPNVLRVSQVPLCYALSQVLNVIRVITRTQCVTSYHRFPVCYMLSYVFNMLRHVFTVRDSLD